MSVVMWEVVKQVWCNRMQQEAQLLEQRVYAAEPVPAVQASYQVRARKCSLGIDCNLAGYSCRWAFNNPNFDPFA